MKNILLVLVAIFAFADTHSFVEINSDGKYEFRVVGKDKKPNATCDNKSLDFTKRFSEDFTVWSADVNNCKSVTFDGKTVTINKKVEKIAVVGDTGCRIKISKNGKGEIQNCDNKNSWPAKKNADLIFLHKPDLVIHVGDYHYREKCENKEICSQFDIENDDIGYGYEIWEDDFFDPYENLLESVPFVFTRGNHESCSRAWQVYKAALSPYPYSECNANDNGANLKKNSFEKPYKLNINGSNFLIFDSSGDDDEGFVQDDYDVYLENFKQNVNYKSILVTHIPIANLNSNELTSRKKAFIDSGYRPYLILSGDVHMLEHLQTKRITQIISGGGGATLYDLSEIKTPFKNTKQFNTFGFAILNKTKTGFDGSFYSFKNEKLYDFKVTK